jgi:hypothetical protein
MRDRTGALGIGSMPVFMTLGYVSGQVLRAVRSSYLFS